MKILTAAITEFGMEIYTENVPEKSENGVS